jgi:hypothetical protein
MLAGKMIDTRKNFLQKKIRGKKNRQKGQGEEEKGPENGKDDEYFFHGNLDGLKGRGRTT